MKVTNVEKKEKSTVELTIQVEADAFEAAIQKVYLKTRQTWRIRQIPVYLLRRERSWRRIQRTRRLQRTWLGT